jgi:hypothetical protein
LRTPPIKNSAFAAQGGHVLWRGVFQSPEAVNALIASARTACEAAFRAGPDKDYDDACDWLKQIIDARDAAAAQRADKVAA